MLGAACLTTEAALRSGAGLVTLACPESIQLHAASKCICATTIPLTESKNGMIDPDAAIRLLSERGIFESEKSPTVVAAGPGIGQSDMGFARSWIDLMREFDRAGRTTIVLDADGLNALALASPPTNGGISWPFGNHFIITPHPGEMGRLCGKSTKEVQAARESVAVSTARRMNDQASGSFHDDRIAGMTAPAVLVLKGAGTIVTDGARIYTNSSGNPGMATGGTGDVLTGIIAGLVAQGLSRFDAAVLGTYTHGIAGDALAYMMGEGPLIATDFFEQITCVLNEKQLKLWVRDLKKRRSKKRG